MPSVAFSLPAFGWTAHAEQTDASSLDARVWSMRTTLYGGKVFTALLSAPPADLAVAIEAIARVQAKHIAECKNPACLVGKNGPTLADLCPNGKFDPSIPCFFTLAFDTAGQAFPELRLIALTPEDAKKNHYTTCHLLTGAVASWSPPVSQPA